MVEELLSGAACRRDHAGGCFPQGVESPVFDASGPADPFHASVTHVHGQIPRPNQFVVVSPLSLQHLGERP